MHNKVENMNDNDELTILRNRLLYLESWNERLQMELKNTLSELNKLKNKNKKRKNVISRIYTAIVCGR